MVTNRYCYCEYNLFSQPFKIATSTYHQAIKGMQGMRIKIQEGPSLYILAMLIHPSPKLHPE